MEKPLAGVCVLDLSRILAGPLATMWMADLGAEVIKVERPGRGDETRRWGPPFVGGESAYFLAANRGKYGITLDLGAPGDRALLGELIGSCDVLVHNFLPGSAERLGIPYRSVRELNPRIVYVSIAGFPPGPYHERPGFDALIQAMGGLMAITGEGERPVKVGVAIVDVLCAWAALSGTLAALLVRERSGRGQEVPISLMGCSLGALANVGQAFLLTGEEPRRLGTAHPHIVPYQAFPARDGMLMVAVGTDSQFRKLCSLLGRPELARDERFATNPDRVAHREELIGILTQIFRSRRRDDWLKEFQTAGIPAGPVNSFSDLFGDAGLTDGLVFWVEHPEVGRYRSIRCPLPQADPPSSLPPPRLGEHNRLIRDRLKGR